ncbi:DUF4430 domain-containing protein [Methanococcoides sp. AM1]|uniref:DUF4430 domain-containing protein n=1 Tax=Methanococcoides sp. AM1 TaxID=1201011 RepID=UPI00108492C8|nr:DUF4430 domain-containing protein [Methanococcoides sp. AM1]
MKTEKIISIALVALLSVMMVGAAAAEPVEIFDGGVNLEAGTFTFVPSNNPTASYQVDTLTDHGALDAASNDEIDGFTYNASDAYYGYFGSFFLTDINGIENTDETSWFIYINDQLAPYGLSDNAVEDDDKITFLYAPFEYTVVAPYIDVDTANATYIVEIEVEIEEVEDEIDLIEFFDGEVKLETGTFTFVPSNNPTASYQVDTLTDHGALDAASNDENDGFTYNASDAYYGYFGSFFLTDINGIENTDETSWFIYINDQLAPYGLSANDVGDNDQLTFLYAPFEYTFVPPYIDVDAANATYVVEIEVEVDET